MKVMGRHATATHVIEKAIDFEVSLADMARKSEQRAWRIAGFSVFITLCMCALLAWLLPLKREVPYLVMADAYTGTASMTRLTTGTHFDEMKASDAVNRSNIWHYILARESWDATWTSERDWRTVHMMSAPEVVRQMRQERDEDNLDSPSRKYGSQSAIRVKILSITPIGQRSGEPPKGATVRFQRLLFDKASGSTQVLDNKLATLEFKYDPNLKMKDEDSVENPLRFVVTHYRVDTDAATPVPVQQMRAEPVLPISVQAS